MANHRISPDTTGKARSLRNNMTDVERKLWQVLPGNQLNGYKFRRQHPIGKYIVDFACIEVKLAIELDGGQHQEQHDDDEQRSAFSHAQGWRVLRFWNNDILNNLAGVLSTIDDALGGLPPPYPSP